jgi:hypothetical protein
LLIEWEESRKNPRRRFETRRAQRSGLPEPTTEVLNARRGIRKGIYDDEI